LLLIYSLKKFKLAYAKWPFLVYFAGMIHNQGFLVVIRLWRKKNKQNVEYDFKIELLKAKNKSRTSIFNFCDKNRLVGSSLHYSKAVIIRLVNQSEKKFVFGFILHTLTTKVAISTNKKTKNLLTQQTYPTTTVIFHKFYIIIISVINGRLKVEETFLFVKKSIFG
jgi:hypothetical protein